MNTQKARTILTEAARLMELSARFQARFGKRYSMTNRTPQEAWDLYDHIQDSQSIIANLLDPQIIEEKSIPNDPWWSRYNVIDVPMAQALIAAASHLIACAAYQDYHEPVEGEGVPYAVKTAQQTIADLLHPKSYALATEPMPVYEAS